ncbi:hypothetical protein ACHAWF_013185 [Thalassiosira exigua]
MPAVSSIDPEWASSLVGLEIKVPEHWWQGRSRKLHGGRITSTSLDDDAGRHFVFETNDEPGVTYPIRYDAVRKYADENQPNFSEYDLPNRPMKMKAKKLKAASSNKRKAESPKKRKTAPPKTDAPAKTKAKTVSPKSSPESTKKDASRLMKLISGNGVDVIGDLKAHLSAGDAKTVQFLKSMYDVDKIKKCLLCDEEVVPGNGSKCSLKCDVEHWEFESHGWDHYNGCHRGDWNNNCSRCGLSFSEDGNEDNYPCQDGDEFSDCYSGEHVFTEEEKEKVLEELEDSRA